MGTSDMTEADWEEYYRIVNAFNIPNADAKRVEIWDKAFLSTKTVRETLWKVYSKGFMDGVNDTSERFKSSAYKQEYDSKLLDKVGEYLFNSTYASEKIADFDFDQTVTFTKAEWFKILEEMKAEVEE